MRHDVIAIETMAKQTVVVGGSIAFFICLKYLLSVEVVFSIFVFLEPVCWLGYRFTILFYSKYNFTDNLLKLKHMLTIQWVVSEQFCENSSRVYDYNVCV